MCPCTFMPHESDGLTQAQLKTRAAMQGTLLDAAVDGIVVIDQRGQVLLFNHAAELLFGYRATEVVGHNVAMLMPAGYAHLQAYAEGGKAHIIGIGRDVEGRRKNGDVFPMYLSVGETLTEQGRIFFGICHDLSSYKQALINRHNAEKRYRDIVESRQALRPAAYQPGGQRGPGQAAGALLRRPETGTDEVAAASP